MALLLRYWAVSAPLFGLVLAGYAVARFSAWRPQWTRSLTRFAFHVPLPALLFLVMNRRAAGSAVDLRILLAFFGSCLVVFLLGRLLWARVGLGGVSGSVLSMGGIFSNNVLLGLPMARQALGQEALSRIALILVFNALSLWTLATVSVEWARQGTLSLRGVSRAAWGVVKNPIVLAILSGTLFHRSGLVLPGPVEAVVQPLGKTAGPLALVCLGLSMAGYGFRAGLRRGLAVCGVKLLVQPLVALALAYALGLSLLDRQVVVLLASLSLGVNVYLMAAQFEAEQAAIASALVVSTAAAAVTAPLLLALASVEWLG